MSEAPAKPYRMTQDPAYGPWQMMWQRVTNPKATRYDLYGGAGVTICDRWRSFWLFLEDVGPRPPKTSLERLRRDLGYEPGNVIWADQKTQNRNTSSNVVIEYRGEKRCLSEWIEILDLPKWPIRSRHRHGWSTERMFETPIRPRRKQEASA